MAPNAAMPVMPERDAKTAFPIATTEFKQEDANSGSRLTSVAATPQKQLSSVADTKVLVAETADTATTPASSPASSDQVLDQVVRYGKEGTGHKDDSIGQVTSVSQLRDVQPTDWAFQALQSLVERYGVIAGYPDGTYRGNRAMTRYEFAAGLNAALNRVNELIAAGTADLVRKEDLATLQRLQEEFATELAALRGRVDTLEARTAQLEANQFSTTTKLVGEAIFAVTNDFGRYQDNPVFQDRVRLDLQTSFTGKDTLHTRLATGNATALNYQSAVGTSEGLQTFNIKPDAANSNRVFVDWLSYITPIGPFQLYVAATGGIHSDYVNTVNPYFESFDGGTGALSVFADESPIYRIGGGAGAGLNIPFGTFFGKGNILGQSSLTLGYLADSANNPTRNAGIFNGDYAALGQLNFNFGDRFAIAGTYVHSYNRPGTGIFNLGAPGSSSGSPGGGFASGITGNGFNRAGVVGTDLANDPSILLGNNPANAVPLSTNTYGVEASFRVSKNISISGFGAGSYVRLLGRGDANVWTYGGGISFPDFGKTGNLLGFFVGEEPTLRGISSGLRAQATTNFSRDEAYHFEGFYKYQVTDNISVTPGVIYLTAPGQNIRNNNAIIGTLRTTFVF
jgi:BMFP domain-containing protein YqiC